MKLQITFQPAGDFSTRPSWDFDTITRPWDVFFSPELYPYGYDVDADRRRIQTKRLIEEVPKYGDYFPDHVCGEAKDDHKAKDIIHACRKLPKATRVAPDSVVAVRFFNNKV
jgi:hypothetical protein